MLKILARIVSNFLDWNNSPGAPNWWQKILLAVVTVVLTAWFFFVLRHPLP